MIPYHEPCGLYYNEFINPELCAKNFLSSDWLFFFMTYLLLISDKI